MKYGISEVFYSIQGEGLYSGTPMTFVRFAGCDFACPWCDTDYSKKFTSDAVEIAEMVVAASLMKVRHVCLTGGEPTLHDLHPIMDEIQSACPSVNFHIETHGASSRGYGKYLDRAFVTVSPKNPDGSAVLSGTWQCGQLKIIDQGQPLVEYNAFDTNGEHAPMYLQPLWVDGQDNARAAHKTACRARADGRFRLSMQTHKIIGMR